jgi:drug/metabolite transporter (DMT)-like permease
MQQHVTAPVGARAELDQSAALILLACCASWGLGQIAVKVGNAGISPVLQAGLRSVGAAILVCLWARWRGVRLTGRDDTLGWGVAAGLLFAVEFLLLYWGLDLTTATRGVIFLYTSPFIVALGTHFFVPADRLTGLKVLGLLAAFAGIVLAFADGLRLPSERELTGDLLCLLAAIAWGATTVLIKASPMARIPAEKTLLYQLAISALLLPPASWLMGERGIYDPTPIVLAALAYQVVIVAFITYVTWFWLIRHYPASRLAAFSFLTPIFGVLFGGLLLEEPVSPLLIGSVALVAAGIYLVNRPAPAMTPAPPAGP